MVCVWFSRKEIRIFTIGERVRARILQRSLPQMTNQDHDPGGGADQRQPRPDRIGRPAGGTYQHKVYTSGCVCTLPSLVPKKNKKRLFAVRMPPGGARSPWPWGDLGWSCRHQPGQLFFLTHSLPRLSDTPVLNQGPGSFLSQPCCRTARQATQK